MQPVTVTVEPDGRVVIPGTRPGQTITILVEPMAMNATTPDPLSSEEQERIRQQLIESGKRLREKASPESLKLARGDWLYGPDGLPE